MNSLYLWILFAGIVSLLFFLRTVLNFQLPVLKIGGALFLILAGTSLLFDNSGFWPVKSGENEFFFRSGKYDISSVSSEYYQVLFSDVEYDLTGVVAGDLPDEIKINTVFSGATIFIDPCTPLKIEVYAILGGVKMPGVNLPLIGRGSYKSAGFDPDLPFLSIKVNIIFGNIVFMNRD